LEDDNSEETVGLVDECSKALPERERWYHELGQNIALDKVILSKG
jgi:hypothetical protein